MTYSCKTERNRDHLWMLPTSKYCPSLKARVICGRAAIQYLHGFSGPDDAYSGT
jgi:hypothetical protein